MGGQKQKQIIARSSRVIKINSEKTWEFFSIQAKKLGFPVVVHFTTTWCMPSVAMNPFFEELALSNPDTLFLLVDVDEVMKVAKQMEIKAMPTFLMIKEGVPVDRLIGANPYEMRERIGSFASGPAVHNLLTV